MCVRAVLSDSLWPHWLYNPPGSSVHGIFQARILEWVAISSSRGLPEPGIKLKSPVSSALAGRFFTTASPGKRYVNKHPCICLLSWEIEHLYHSVLPRYWYITRPMCPFPKWPLPPFTEMISGSFFKLIWLPLVLVAARGVFFLVYLLYPQLGVTVCGSPSQ